MSTVIRQIQAGLQGYGSMISQKNNVNNLAGNANPFSQKPNQYDEAHAQKISSMKRMINGTEKKTTNSIVDSTLQYGNQVRQSRQASNSTATSLKKLRYNAKSISSQLIRSKTSVNAKQVASKAKREVVQLKLKLQTGKYDEEELQAAIAHAQSMERAAKKKARHLEEEELVKITDKATGGQDISQLEDELEKKLEDEYKAQDASMEEEAREAAEEMSEEQIREMEEAIEASMEEVQEMIENQTEEVTEDMMGMLTEMMQDMMEETLGDLADSMLAIADSEMTENEFKEFKTKHRTDEDKDIMEADAKYLKAIFDHYSKMLNGSGSGKIDVGAAMGAMSAGAPSVDLAQALSGIVGSSGGGIDISV